MVIGGILLLALAAFAYSVRRRSQFSLVEAEKRRRSRRQEEQRVPQLTLENAQDLFGETDDSLMEGGRRQSLWIPNPVKKTPTLQLQMTTTRGTRAASIGPYTAEESSVDDPAVIARYNGYQFTNDEDGQAASHLSETSADEHADDNDVEA